jgi:hypothetical protein
MDQADTDFRIFADHFGDRSGNRPQERVAMFDQDAAARLVSSSSSASVRLNGDTATPFFAGAVRASLRWESPIGSSDSGLMALLALGAV